MNLASRPLITSGHDAASFRTVTSHAFNNRISIIGRSQWPRSLRRESAAARLLGLGLNPAEGIDVCLW
jgi:hypothetical protein